MYDGEDTMTRDGDDTPDDEEYKTLASDQSEDTSDAHRWMLFITCLQLFYQWLYFGSKESNTDALLFSLKVQNLRNCFFFLFDAQLNN